MLPSKFIVIASCVLTFSIADKKVEVQMPLGTIKGEVIENEYPDASSKDYVSFKGLRYVRAVTEYTKFLPPSDPEPWDGVYEATEYCENCLAYNFITESIEGETDCLCLNVYTPSLPEDDHQCKPVLVFIHGGAFIYGSGDNDFFGPDFLIRDGDIVVVTLNYRLAVTGFLNGKTKAIAGNQGLKDQRAALRWVKKYIEYFGGCADKITLTGESAGSASVHYLLLSNSTDGLFHQAIRQSGSATDSWAFSTIEDESFFYIAGLMGIKSEDREQVAEELTKIPAKDIMEKWLENDSLTDFSKLRFLPSVEALIENEEPMVPESPFKMVASGQTKKIPMVIGTNSDEGALFARFLIDAALEAGRDFSSSLEGQFDFYKAMTQSEKNDFLKTLGTLYSTSVDIKDLKEIPIRSIIDFISDVSFFSQHSMVRKFLEHHHHENVYNYHLEYRSLTGGLKDFLEFNEPVCIHSDDLFMLYYSDTLYNVPDTGSPEEKIMILMTQMWKNFVITGKPTPAIDEITPVEWPEMGQENNIFFIGNDKMWVDNKFYEERMKFWISYMKAWYGDKSVIFDESK